MRRKDKELSYDRGLDIIDKAVFGSLACIDLDGKPYVVNLNMVRVDNNLYFHSAMSGKKVDIFNVNKDVCVSFVTDIKVLEEMYSTRYQSSIVYGTISKVVDDKEKYDALKALTYKFCRKFMDKFEDCSKGLTHTNIYKITIEEMTVKGNDLDE